MKVKKAVSGGGPVRFPPNKRVRLVLGAIFRVKIFCCKQKSIFISVFLATNQETTLRIRL